MSILFHSVETTSSHLTSTMNSGTVSSDHSTSFSGTDSDIQSASPSEAGFHRRQFLLTTLVFCTSRAMLDVGLLYAPTALEESTGNAANAAFFGSTMSSSLFLSSAIYSVLGFKWAFSLGSVLCFVYVGFLGIAAEMCTSFDPEGACLAASESQLLVALASSIAGGTGFSVLCLTHGAFLVTSCDRLSSVQVRPPSLVNEQLAGQSVIFHVVLNVLCNGGVFAALAWADAPVASVFELYIFIGIVAVPLWAVLVGEISVPSHEEVGSQFNTIKAVVSLWHQPKWWLLQPMVMARGFGMAVFGGYITRNILVENTKASFLSLFGGGILACCALLTRTCVTTSGKVGKSPILVCSVASTIAMGLLLVLRNREVMGMSQFGAALVCLHVAALSAYDGAARGIFLHHFPSNRSFGAIMNMIIINSGATCVGFALCSAGKSKFAVVAMLVCAVHTIPCFAFASVQRREVAVSEVRKLQETPPRSTA